VRSNSRSLLGTAHDGDRRWKQDKQHLGKMQQFLICKYDYVFFLVLIDIFVFISNCLQFYAYAFRETAFIMTVDFS
jgi:hypothetical protein